MSSTTSTADAANNLFDIYVKSTFDLAKTIVIKLDQVARKTNNLVMQLGYAATIDVNDRTTWKYYQNIAGVYNSSDTQMYIESLDGGGHVLFSKATLAASPGTKSAYTYGSYYYNELVAKYPDQERLILGIIYPADIDEAVAAPDGTILSYPSFLVEENEINFIEDLQFWVTNFVGRWIVQAYAITDDLYVATYLSQLALNMVPAAMNIRLRYCKTNQAHSFHVGQYLRSHGFLDFYLSELTREQTLAFYRNIKYYIRHAGFTGTFEELVDLLLTKRSLPAYEYEFNHNAGSISYTDPNDFTNLYPTAIFRRRPLNTVAEAIPLPDYVLADVFNAIAKSAPGNAAWNAAHESEISQQFLASPSSLLKTKILEVGLPSTSLSAIRTPEVVYLNEWAARAADGSYQYRFTIIPPNTAIPVQLSQQQALALWIYSVSEAIRPAGDATFPQMTRVPPIVVSEVVPTVAPDRASIRSLTTKAAISDSLLDTFLGLVVLAPTDIVSVEEFTTHCANVYDADNTMFHIYATQSLSSPRGQLEYVFNACHKTYTTHIDGLYTQLSPYQGVLYSDFFNTIGFNPSSLTQSELFDLATKLFQTATGFNLDSTANPLNVQAAMVALLRQLCSYSVLIVTNTQLSNTLAIPHQEARLNNQRVTESEHIYVNSSPVDVVSKEISDAGYLLIDMDVLAPLQTPVSGDITQVDIELPNLGVFVPTASETAARLVEIALDLKSDDDIYAEFNMLTLLEQQSLAEMP